MTTNGMLSILLCGELALTVIALVLAFGCRRAARRSTDAKPPALPRDDGGRDDKTGCAAPVGLGRS